MVHNRSSNMVTRTPSEPFRKVKREDVLSNRVAAMLLERILGGELLPGEELPSERDLSEQFGVSRTVVREAIRSLAGKGVIDARGGRKARIGLVGRDQVVESMQLFIQGLNPELGGIPYRKVHEVRKTIELTVAELAAERASERDLERLRGVYDRMQRAENNLTLLAALDIEFHRVIVEMTGNELFLIMLDSIGGVLVEIRRTTLEFPGRPASAFASHGAILAALESGDARMARRAMQQHLAESADVWIDSDRDSLKPNND